jgi:DNA polymerase-4
MTPRPHSAEAAAHWPRVILHADMDAFFASVEIRDDPSLAGKPVLVGGSAEGRGVVSAASYEARRYGVHSAMPMATALRRCPDAVVLRGRMERYSEVSRQVCGIFETFTPLVEPVSVDEAFLDVTGSQRLLGPAPAIARALKERVRAATGLTVSVGVAPNKFAAKIASDLEKPDGLVILPREAVRARLAKLPVERLWGVGGQMARALHRLNLRTVGDLAAWPAAELEARFGQAGAHLARLARGEDDRAVTTQREVKSVSHETTFARDVTDPETLRAALVALADKVAARMRASQLQGRTVQLKVRYEDFSTVTRRATLPRPCALAKTLIETGWRILCDRTEALARPVRLIGIGMGELLDAGGAAQDTLFGAAEEARQETMERTAESIRRKLGDEAVRRGLHVRPPGDPGADRQRRRPGRDAER